MQKLLSELNRKYNLKIGIRKLSPVMQCSVGLSMRYIEGVSDGSIKTPFHLNYPDKQNAALWLSIALLRNFFLEDYINQSGDRINELGLSGGDKVELFGVTAIFRGVVANKLSLEFNGQAPIEFNMQLADQLNRSKKKTVNKFLLYRKKSKELRINRNAISRMLEPDDPIPINKGVLTSEVLVIAGRGNTGKFVDKLKAEQVYNSSLSEVFGIGENLIIRPDLEDYKHLVSSANAETGSDFTQAFIRYHTDLLEVLPDQKDLVLELNKLVEEGRYRTRFFITQYEKLLEGIDPENHERIYNIYKRYPGIEDKISENLRAVIINDIELVEDYKALVQEFILNKVPVFVISNRYANNLDSLKIFQSFFSNNSSDLRLNWNRKKIKELTSAVPEDSDFLDSDLWKSSTRFSEQEVLIHVCEGHPIDNMISACQREILKIEGHEKIKDAYWKFFNPLIYSFKNSSSWEGYHQLLMDKFSEVLKASRNYLSEGLVTIFENIIDEINKRKESAKNFEAYRSIYAQHVSIDGEDFIFPKQNSSKLVSDISEDTKEVTFTGFPLNEPIAKPLLNSVSDYFVPGIKIICWPIEAKLAYSYLRRRIIAGYFTDYLPEEWEVGKEFLLNNQDEVSNEVDLILSPIEASPEEIKESVEVEIEMEQISSFKYSGYQSSGDDNETHIVSCNIVELEGGSFLFLPKTSSILAKLESGNAEIKFKRAKFSELKIGDEIYQYNLSRSSLRELTRNVDGTDRFFNDLEIWKDAIKKLYKDYDSSTGKLAKLLSDINTQHSVGGSPNRANIRNWIFDEDMLCPDAENLKLILLASRDKELIKKESKILKANRKARAITVRISNFVKHSIIKRLEEIGGNDSKSFVINVFGQDIIVKHRRIIDLQKTDMAIDYKDTRKIIN